MNKVRDPPLSGPRNGPFLGVNPPRSSTIEVTVDGMGRGVRSDSMSLL